MSGASSGVRIGVDLGGTKLLAVAFGATGAVLAERRVETLSGSGADRIVERVAELVESLEVPRDRLEGVGVGFAGLVDHRTGHVDSSVILPGFDDYPLRARLEAQLGCRVVVDNDATAAGLGEHVASGRNQDELLLVLTVGTGIGGAIVHRGRILRGASNTSAEFGNMTIDWQGEPHSCGNRGCLNTFASGPAIVGEALRRTAAVGGLLAAREGRLPAGATLEAVAAAAADGDDACRQAIERGADALGTGIANLLNAFNPDRVALAGGVLGLPPWFLERVVATARGRAFGPNARAATIGACREPLLCGARGAAELTREVADGR